MDCRVKPGNDDESWSARFGMNAPGYRLHRLKGSRDGQWAAWVSGYWRLVFAFDGSDAINADLADYS